MQIIRFNSKYFYDDSSDITSTDILDVVETYLKESGFQLIKRKHNKLFFHLGFFSGLNPFHIRGFLVSGTVIVEKEKGYFLISNGNWMVITISLPFLILYALTFTSAGAHLFNTYGDKHIFYLAFIWIVGANIVGRFLAHWKFKFIIKKAIASIKGDR